MMIQQALRRAALAAAVFAGSMLGACSRAPEPVHFFAEGRPQRLSEWHVVFRDGGRLALNERVVPYDLNTPLFSDYAHKLRTVWMPPGASAKYESAQSFDFPGRHRHQQDFLLSACCRRRCRGVAHL